MSNFSQFSANFRTSLHHSINAVRRRSCLCYRPPQCAFTFTCFLLRLQYDTFIQRYRNLSNCKTKIASLLPFDGWKWLFPLYITYFSTYFWRAKKNSSSLGRLKSVKCVSSLKICVNQKICPQNVTNFFFCVSGVRVPT